MIGPPAGPAPGEDIRTAIIGGAVFLVSGLSLVAHILTGAPLWALLAGLTVAGGVTVHRLVWLTPERRATWLEHCRIGALVGVAATAAYDAARWALVEVGGLQTSPFKAFPLFGDALLGGLGNPSARAVAGIAFHLLNGIAFGMAYRWWGIPFALGLEAFMLGLYPGWLDVRSLREFAEISLVGHLVYGTVLGMGTARARQRGRPVDGPAVASAR